MALSLHSRAGCALPVRRPSSALAVVPRKTVARKLRAEPVRMAEKDFDQVLAEFADKFEKVENKPVVVAWIAAAVSAFIFTEWLIHLPALDIVLGFPMQLIGVFMTPVLVLRYVVDKKAELSQDVIDTVGDISKRLPGLDK